MYTNVDFEETRQVSYNQELYTSPTKKVGGHWQSLGGSPQDGSLFKRHPIEGFSNIQRNDEKFTLRLYSDILNEQIDFFLREGNYWTNVIWDRGK